MDHDETILLSINTPTWVIQSIGEMGTWGRGPGSSGRPFFTFRMEVEND